MDTDHIIMGFIVKEILMLYNLTSSSTAQNVYLLV